MQNFIHFQRLYFVTCLTSLLQISGSKVCHSLDIRNNVENLKKLEGCMVVEGYVQIVLMERANETDFEPYIFPDLREITDYLMFYRVKGLRSLGKLFPNLEIIRGDNPFNGGFSLVVDEMFSLTEVDLYSLREISKGSVIIFKNPILCYVNTVDWDRITRRPTEVNYKALNRPAEDCPFCPQNCPDKLCWSASHCQVKKKHDCHPQCVGGCHSPGPRGCYTCHGVFNPQGECVTQCPAKTYQFLNRRCIARNECNSTPTSEHDSEMTSSQSPFENLTKNYVIFEGSCLAKCPPGYEVNSRGTECQKCREGSCKKSCPGAAVTSMQDAQKLRGCTSINGSLEIIIKSDNSETVRIELEENLGSIEVINGHLKVSRSSLTDLNFFKNLSTIFGSSTNESNEHYALMISENQNLQELWNWDRKENLTILGGKLFFHYNPKLCLDHIYKLIDVINYDSNFTDLEISRASNGDKFPCSKRKIDVNVTNRTHNFIQIHIPYIPNVFWYVLYYTKDPYKNVSMFDDLDQCSDYNWRTKDISVDYEDKDMTAQGFLVDVTDLEPDTQYAFYVTTYTINSTGAISDMNYEATLPTTPTELTRFHAFSNSSSTIVLQWEPPYKANGKLSEYVVTWTPLKEDISYILQRNYCEFPMDYTSEPDDQIDDKPRKKIDLDNCCHDVQDPKHDQSNWNDQYCLALFKDPLLQENPKFPSCKSHFYVYLHKYQFIFVDSSGVSTDQSNVSRNEQLKLKDSIEPRKANITLNLNRLPAQSSDTVIDGLMHFQNYVITLKACRDQHPNENSKTEDLRCSKAEVVTIRTQSKEVADKINDNIRLIIKNRSVSIYWESPENPNGLVVAFEIQYQRRDLKNPNPIPECITFTDYENGNRGFSMTEVPLGRYEIRLRAVSLSGKGPFTEFFPFDVIDARFSSLDIIFIIVSVLVCVCLIIIFLWHIAHSKNPIPEVVIADVNPNYQYIPDSYEVDRRDVEFGKELGVGSFGKVFQGVLKPNNTSCAIKTIGDNAVDDYRDEFLSEATVMKTMNQAHHIVKLLGVVSVGNPPLVLMQLMEFGDLKSYLRSVRDRQIFGNGTMIQMASEIADAMTFMEAKKFIHRDLAARNCMVSSELSVKIGDFGMARDIYETDYYRKKNKGLLPIRWMAPESLKDGEFTSQSDVWSFGVVLWELVTMAEQPYQGSTNDQVLQDVIAGRRLEIPGQSPLPLKMLMKSCWMTKARERPRFMQIMTSLQYYHDEEFRKVAYFYSPEAVAQRNTAWEYVEMQSIEDPLLQKSEN